MRTVTGSCLKLVVFLFNLLFVIFSILSITVASLALTNLLKFEEFSGNFKWAFIGVIGVMSFLLALTFLACCGALLESYFMLSLFSYIVGALVVFQLVCVVLVFRFRSSIEGEVAKIGQGFISNYEHKNTTRELVDDIQWGLRCCGFNSTADWNDYRSNTTESPLGNFPDSCCSKFDHKGHPKNPDTCAKPDFILPCARPIYDVATKMSFPLMVILGSFLGVQVVSMLLACCLANSTRSRYHEFV